MALKKGQFRIELKVTVDENDKELIEALGKVFELLSVEARAKKAADESKPSTAG